MDSASPFSITIGYRRRVDYAFLKPDGSPGRVDGPIDLAVSDFDVGKVTDNNDNKSFYVAAIGAGPFTVTQSADVDLGAGVKTVTKVLYFVGVDLMVDHIDDQVGDEEADPDFGGNNHVEPPPVEPQPPRPEPEPPQAGTAAPSVAGDAGPTPPAAGDVAAGGEGPEPAVKPAAGT